MRRKGDDILVSGGKKSKLQSNMYNIPYMNKTD